LRERVVLGWERLAGGAGLGTLLQVGYEHMRNFNFLTGNDINGFLGRMSFQYSFQ